MKYGRDKNPYFVGYIPIQLLLYAGSVGNLGAAEKFVGLHAAFA